MTREENEEIFKAITVPLPGGVNLTDEERELRESVRLWRTDRDLVVARSILRKVRTACVIADAVE